ncbi:MAG: TfuA-related McrA-glycine thioamidation protein [Candidatus Methanoperedenaceae archaeon]|nr:TfuA-related McrA-glycine thioamidation protein [Candidatus Methanoperedenaceae archaeon]
MKVVVYTGMSISHSDAKNILDADYRPPVQRNDIKKIINSGFDIIGIIEGVFFNSAAVAHREIIEALNKGITVIGGSSMGALRAYELEPYGMIGVGRIFEMYKNGFLESDDEVAVTFDPETLEPLSIPLVNVRLTLDAAQDEGVLTQERADAVLDVTKRMFYPDRNFRNIVDACVKEGVVDENQRGRLVDYFIKNEVDVKREDAILVLLKIQELRE